MDKFSENENIRSMFIYLILMKNERCINVVACSKSNVYFKCKLICVLCIIGQCEYNTSNSNKSGHIHALI